MLLLISSIKMVAEIALMCILGQWVLGLLAGARREQNAVYRLFDILNSPAVKAARLMTPRLVLDRHMRLTAALMLSFIWLAALIFKIDLCLALGMQACR